MTNPRRRPRALGRSAAKTARAAGRGLVSMANDTMREPFASIPNLAQARRRFNDAVLRDDAEAAAAWQLEYRRLEQQRRAELLQQARQRGAR